MNNETLAAELELPQIRQMVLENTRRIEKNEQMIDEMRKKKREEEQKQRERDTYWDISRDEHDRAHREHQQDMRELRELLRDHSVRFDEDLKRSREEDEERHRKFDEDLKRSREEDEERHRKFDEDLKKSREEDEERHRKFDEDLKKSREEDEERHRKFDEDLKKSREEFDQRMRVLDKKIDETREAVKNLARQVSSVTGNIIEGLISPQAHKMFENAGYEVTDTCKRVQISDKEKHTVMEIDVLMYGEKQLIAIEVKTDCELRDIKKIIRNMERFKTLQPMHADKEVLAGVAAINFEDGVYEFAKKNGLIIVHVKEDSVFELEPDFTLDPVPDKSVLRRF
jgi:hypothetical protein